MVEHSITTPTAQSLLTTLLTLLQPLRQTCQQERPFQRLVALVLAATVNLGRQTLTQALCWSYPGFVDSSSLVGQDSSFHAATASSIACS